MQENIVYKKATGYEADRLAIGRDNGPSVVEKEGILFVLIREQAKAIEELTSLLNEMEGKIQPVLSSEPEKDDTMERPGAPPDFEIGRLVDVNTIRIAQLINGGRSVLRRLRL